ncbi:hypothetical protein Anapl_04766 [Anas platyrhynchos]|uniref:Uncharacterized protein n=1 Tax=Anas platyrhynchos TaxID=8839 RepID=R0K7H5_ANAPL|nr:hypothetical protein Anapl_04766 [Anas platyrhynchos]
MVLQKHQLKVSRLYFELHCKSKGQGPYLLKLATPLSMLLDLRLHQKAQVDQRTCDKLPRKGGTHRCKYFSMIGTRYISVSVTSKNARVGNMSLGYPNSLETAAQSSRTHGTRLPCLTAASDGVNVIVVLSQSGLALGFVVYLQEETVRCLSQLQRPTLKPRQQSSLASFGASTQHRTVHSDPTPGTAPRPPPVRAAGRSAQDPGLRAASTPPPPRLRRRHLETDRGQRAHPGSKTALALLPRRGEEKLNCEFALHFRIVVLQHVSPVYCLVLLVFAILMVSTAYSKSRYWIVIFKPYFFTKFFKMVDEFQIPGVLKKKIIMALKEQGETGVIRNKEEDGVKANDRVQVQIKFVMQNENFRLMTAAMQNHPEDNLTSCSFGATEEPTSQGPSALHPHLYGSSTPSEHSTGLTLPPAHCH